MEYKYNFDIIVIDKTNLWNQTILEVDKMMNENNKDLLSQLSLTHSITTEVPPTKEIIETLTIESEKIIRKVFDEQGVFDIVSYSFNNVEVAI